MNLHHIEKIKLALNAIDYMSVRLELGAMEITGSVSSEKIAASHREHLEQTIMELQPIMERLGEYMNGTDMTQKTDEIIVGPAFDLLRPTDEG